MKRKSTTKRMKRKSTTKRMKRKSTTKRMKRKSTKQNGGMENYHCNGIIPNIKIIPETGFDLKSLLNKTGVGMPPDINL
jgi:hypothetical protein